MSERRLLTRNFVNRVKPPKRGERWIADASVAGFGLRLWSTSTGGNKAFSIRLRDPSGKQVRRTYPVEESYASRAYLYWGRDFSLGHCLEDARSWARDQMDVCHGRPTLADIDRADRKLAADRIKNLTLGIAGEFLLKGLYARGYSQIYIDRLDKLFYGNIPPAILATPLIDVKAEEVARILIDERLSFGNIRILRAFVCQIFEEARWFYGPLGGLHAKLI